MRVLIAYDGSIYADAAIDDLRRAGLPKLAEALVVSVAHRGWPEHPTKDQGQFDNSWKATMKEAEALAEHGRKLVTALFPGDNVGLRNAVVETLASFGRSAIPAVTRIIGRLDPVTHSIAHHVSQRFGDSIQNALVEVGFFSA